MRDGQRPNVAQLYAAALTVFEMLAKNEQNVTNANVAFQFCSDRSPAVSSALTHCHQACSLAVDSVHHCHSMMVDL